ncbi:MAG: carboxypeptidase regulatory-like domain-containing protein, partial [Bryobacteraceae bacterium]
MNHLFFVAVATLLSVVPSFAQSTGATVSGRVLDPTDAPITGAKVTLKPTSSEFVREQSTEEGGNFSFPNLQQGEYEIEVTANGFKSFNQRNILIRQYENVRIPVTLELGETSQRVEVVASVSALNMETPEVKGTLPKREIEALPLQVAGGQRSAATFVTLLPGVSPGGGQSDAFRARFNGGQRFSDEAILDGVTMQEGLLSQSGMVAIQNDFPIAPEAVNEISVLTSNYDVQFGASSAAVIIASTKSGTNEFHGDGYQYHRNSAFNARPWNASTRPFTLQNDFGGFLGGPIKLKPFWTTNVKTYFFAHLEGFRSVGSTTAPILT